MSERPSEDIALGDLNSEIRQPILEYEILKMRLLRDSEWLRAPRWRVPKSFGFKDSKIVFILMPVNFNQLFILIMEL